MIFKNEKIKQLTENDDIQFLIWFNYWIFLMNLWFMQWNVKWKVTMFCTKLFSYIFFHEITSSSCPADRSIDIDPDGEVMVYFKRNKMYINKRNSFCNRKVLEWLYISEKCFIWKNSCTMYVQFCLLIFYQI